MRARSEPVRLLELGLLLLLGVIWGIPYALTKISLETIPPVTLTAARVSLAATALWIIAVALGRRIPRRWDFAWRIFIQGGVACVIPYTLIAIGQQSVDSGLAAILNSSTPLFVCLIGIAWTHHEPVTFGRLSGALVGLGGVVVIMGASALSGLGRPTLGQALIIMATFSSALSAIHGRRFTEVAPEVVAAGMLTAAAIILVPLCLVLETPWRAAPSPASLAALAANAIGATALGFIIYFRLIRTIGSLGTASTGYIKPAVGVLIGCAFFGEALTWTMALGLTAILFGVAVINQRISPPAVLDWFRRRLKRSPPHAEPLSAVARVVRGMKSR
jgi:drug/metabolite transporter (DMT)-like permease